jgi:cytochrome c biogenesis protein CcdA
MTDLISTLTPILIVDVLNPVLFALMIVAIGTTKPIANSTALLFGHTAAYIVSGIVIALGLEQITARLETPHTIDSVIELILGLLILWAALTSRDGGASETRNPERELSPFYCLGYGAIVNFIGIPFALPYFAAVDQILRAGLPTESAFVVLATYNIAYALPFLLVPVSVALIGDQCKPYLERINELLVGLVDKLMPFLLLALGIFPSVDAIRFLATGEAFF